MSKLWFAICTISALLFTGCNSGDVAHWDDDGRIVRIVDISEHFDLYCDKSTNIVYLRYWGPNRAGLTVYLDGEGKPARCNEVRR